MPVPFSQLSQAATASSWFAALIAAANTLGLPTTAWQSGTPELTILQLTSQALSQEDGIASIWGQGGFLQYAATGTVTYTTVAGVQVTQPVTPDPSIAAQNPTGAPGLLDALCVGIFNVTRLPATFAPVSMSITNASASSYGPFAPGTYHVSNPSTGETYSNAASLTIAPSATTVANFTADVIGPTGTSAGGAINTTVTSLVGVTVTNPSSCVGNNYESNTAYAARSQLSLGLLSPNGASQAYQFVALSATQSNPNIIGSPVTLAGGAVTRAITILNVSTGQIDLYMANAGGALVSGDVTLVDGLIQATCVSDTQVAVSHSATAAPITFVVTAYVPAAKTTQVVADISTAITNYIASLPIGGVTVNNPNVVPFDAVLGACFEGAPYAKQITLTMNGGTSDITLTTTQVATIASVSVTGVPA